MDTPHLYPEDDQDNVEILQTFCKSTYNTAILHKNDYNVL